MTKDSPWVDWELFPDFKAVEPLMTAELAIPFFQNLIQSTLEKFKASEANFEPTWESTVKQRKGLPIHQLFETNGSIFMHVLYVY
jgi:hypothetical protein